MNLSDEAYLELKRMILAGHFSTDKALSERALASQLSMSRVPIREAIKELEREGLLIVIPRTGIYMRRLTVDEVRELYEVRQAVEGMAALLCASGRRRGEMREIRERLEGLASTARVDYAAVQRESVLFHRKIFDLCGNSQLLSLYQVIEPKIDLNLRLTAIHAPQRVKQVLAEHLDIARAIEAGDAEKAEGLTRSHLENGKKARIRILRAFGSDSASPVGKEKTSRLKRFEAAEG
jgi:DNA-binding GntR family transcriptional regulator